MKSYKQLFSEVAQPKSPDEINFKAKHEIDFIDHPESEEGQHTTMKKKAKRLADYNDGEDEDVYESTELDEAQIDKMKKVSRGFDSRPSAERENDRLVGSKKASGKSYVHKFDDGKYYVVDLKESKLDPVDKKAVKKDFDNRKDKDIDNDGDVDDSDEYLHKRRKAISKNIDESNDQIKKILGSDLSKDFVDYKNGGKKASIITFKNKVNHTDLARKFGYRNYEVLYYGIKDGVHRYEMMKESANLDERNDTNAMKRKSMDAARGAIYRLKNKNAGVEDDPKHKTAQQKNKAVGRALRSEDLDEASQDTYRVEIKGEGVATVKGANRNQAISRALSKLGVAKFARSAYTTGARKGDVKVMKESVEDLTENFKTGSMKLDDGSYVSVKKQDADLLNQMFKDLNSQNKKQMMKVAMTDKAGFEEILGFAREAL